MLTIDADMVVQGTFHVLGTVRLEGRCDGLIVCTRLEVGIDGYLNGDLFAEELVVAGQIVGRMHARHVHLLSGAIVEGELIHERLQMDEAATLVGESRRHRALQMPPEFIQMQARSRSADDDFRNLETESRVRRVEEALAARRQFEALRARFPAPKDLLKAPAY
jgi:cytoskeletal protein CcmA (bactofilin family)